MTERKPQFIAANWRVPDWVKAVTTTRIGGVSEAPFDQFNLGDHVGDRPEHVLQNRKVLQSELELPNAPIWLDQVHGVRVAEVSSRAVGEALEADAAVTRERGCVLAIMTADCLPIVLSSPENNVISAVHGGWRGLAGDIIQNAVIAMDCPPSSIEAWLGPAIGPECFEVGDDVWDQFVSQDWKMAECFRATKDQKFMADLYAIARRSLSTLGITNIVGGNHCTYTEDDMFYSYRRSPNTGRMATLAWMTP
ncbi:MAG: peptidoglycan editing factor PgeF [Gammaproteobacteria bacterium]